MFIEQDILNLAPSLRFERGEQVQLVRFIPMLAMIWADHDRQPEEVELFYSFVDRFVLKWIPGMSTAEARAFFAPFMRETLSEAQRKELARLFDYLLLQFGQKLADDRKLDLYQLCQEVASAARAQPESASAAPRCISPEEQVLLLEMIHALHLDASIKQGMFAARSDKLFDLRRSA